MKRILIAELKQETATFNPWPTRYDDFRVARGDEILATYSGTKTELAGAIDVFHSSGQVEIVPTLAAAAVSGGPIVEADLDRLIDELLSMVHRHESVDAAYLCLHGAMAGEQDDDPEGRLLAAVREILGKKPLVASLDLHAVLTDKMLAAADILVPFHTYPHVDLYQTGQRAARNVLRLLNGGVRPTTACVHLPMLVRGDELLTATGKFGQATGRCAALEQEPGVLAAGVIIGNAFTDVPALQSHVLVTTDYDQPRAEREAMRIAQFMWQHRELFQARLTQLDEALRIAAVTHGLTILSDGADATASGASGDSNAILRELLKVDPACQAGLVHHDNSLQASPSEKKLNQAVGAELDLVANAVDGGSENVTRNKSRPAGGTYWALLPIVDAPAVAKAFECGVGYSCSLSLGGTRDPGRFVPLPVEAYIKSLHDGEFRYEDGTVGRAGRAAVLIIGSIHVLVTERPVYVVGRRVFQAHGLEPLDFSLVVVKSPNGYRTWYEPYAARMIPVDVPGSTSANLRSLPYRRCVRPIFPLDEQVAPPFPTGDDGRLDSVV